MSWPAFIDSPSALLIMAFLLDLAIGDPRWLPHPVVLIGKLASRGERLLWSGKARQDFLAGMILTVLVVGLSWGLASGVLFLFSFLPLFISFVAAAVLASTTIATRGLLDAMARVEEPLRAGDILGARWQLSRIVGRETQHLDQDKILRAGLESLAESTCDGIVAPLFYLFLGGIPLAMAYKAVSTMDSMIGYRTERYFYFGKFAAHLDDVFNFVPARLTAFFMVVATFLMRHHGTLALKILWRDHTHHLSPNAGYPEAALAGAFGIRLGGPSIYFGKEIRKPYIGEEFTPVTIGMLKEARSLCLVTAVLSLLAFLSVLTWMPRS